MWKDYWPVYVMFALAFVFNLGVWVGFQNPYHHQSKTCEFSWR